MAVESDTRRRAVKNARDEGVIRWALEFGLEPEALLQILDDYATVEGRIEPADMVRLLSEEQPAVEPEIGRIEGRDTGLFYRGCVNMLYGTDGCGKTLLMQKVIMQLLEDGDEILYLDAEEGNPRNMVLRLQQMGVNPEWGSRLHYFNLDRPPTPEARAMFIDISQRCALVVIDSVGELMGMYAKDSAKDLETRSILFEMYGRPLAKGGAAVLAADHIAKSSDGSMPIGTIRKRAGVDGAAYYQSIDEGNEWSKTRGGYGQLTCTKDRNGTYYRGEHVARIQVFPAATSATGELVVELSWCEHDDQRIEDLIETRPPAAQPLADVEAAVIEIVQAAPNPVRHSYVHSELHLRGIDLTKGKVNEMLADLAKRGWLRLDNKVGFTIQLHSV